MTQRQSKEITINFTTKYTTFPGQILFLIGDHPFLGCWSRTNAIEMNYDSGQEFNWVRQIQFSTSEYAAKMGQTDIPSLISFEYKYIVISGNQNYASNIYNYDIRRDTSAEICWDTGPNRKLIIDSNLINQSFTVSTVDLFQPPLPTIQNLFFKKPFTEIVYRHEYDPKTVIIKSLDSQLIQVRFRVIALQIPPNCKVYITGSLPLFQNWTHFEPLSPCGHYYWEFVINLPSNSPQFDYKYLFMPDDSQNLTWENRGNRVFKMPPHHTDVVIYHDWLLKGPQEFKGAGLLTGLFSVHSKKSLNKIGEFPDIKLLVDIAVKANFLLIQLLPLQDTVCYYDKSERHISRLVSAFAFNPVYLSLRLIQGYEEVEPPTLSTDFFPVVQFKLQQLRNHFDTKVDKIRLRETDDFRQFLNQNSYWLPSYCYWCSIRDQQIIKNRENQTVDPPQWPPIEQCHIPDLLNTPLEQENFLNCLFHSWVQYQCHLQLLDASRYAYSNRVILSSTITIGQNLFSSECWAHPEYFDTNYTLGAPPDIFSFHGQNWYYPAWKFEQMQQDDFMWLRCQLKHREKYFQASTFDHPLGLFRLWNIPSDTDNPLFGHFEPSIPIDTRDLYEHGISDIFRLFHPLFPIIDIQSFPMSPDIRETIIQRLAIQNEQGIWLFKPELRTDRDIKKVFKELKTISPEGERLQLALAKKIVLSHFESVCLIPNYTKSDLNEFYPRYAMTDSTVFKTLPEREAQILYKMFVDFYYRTNINLWHENAHHKLCVFASSPMQFFAYDVGASLTDEEPILHRFGICSCHAQRIPREPTLRIDQISNFPYLSVCTPSTQDMPHLAIWWRNQQADVQQFYHQVLKMEGAAPLQITPKIASAMINMHLEAKSMWCFLLFEDLFSLTDEFQKVQQLDDWLIQPSTKGVKCGYRMHISLDKLLEKHDKWFQDIAQMVENSKRGRSANFR